MANLALGRTDRFEVRSMLNGKKVLALIPARGGSKRLPRKNILSICGKPLIVWTIEASLSCNYIDKTIVSTDDKEIKDISLTSGAEVVDRPSDLSGDEVPTVPVVEHTLSIIKENYTYLILLQPTTPLRTKRHIDEAFQTLIKTNADAVISVCESEHNPLWANRLPVDGNLKNFRREDIRDVRSQDLPKYHRINGAIYICEVSRLLRESSFYIKDNIFSYIMDKTCSVDIDDQFDFLIAETLMKNLERNTNPVGKSN